MRTSSPSMGLGLQPRKLDARSPLSIDSSQRDLTAKADKAVHDNVSWRFEW